MSSRTPFDYPRSRHVRKQRPPAFADYRRYKPFLREEFGRQCVYCRMPDGPKTPDQFGADHYKPKKKFPALEAEYRNLLYSCNACNSRKQEFWPTPAQRKRGVYIPSPCQHNMSQHLRYHRAEVRERTIAGSWTVDLLDLNREEEVNYRAWLVRQIERTLADRTALRSALGKIKRALRRKLSSQKMSQLQAHRVRLRDALVAAEQDLEMMTGAE